jgi:CBS domain-containing protein
MLCPHCAFENIAGADECANCKQDLTYLNQPNVATDSPVELALMEGPVSMLRPAAPMCVSPDTPLREVLDLMAQKKTACVLVTEGTDLLGIFTERDLLMNIAGREQDLREDQIREWMTPNPETVEKDDSIAFAIHKMDIGGYRHLPVIRDGRPVGILSVRDVVRFLAGRLSPVSEDA